VAARGIRRPRPQDSSGLGSLPATAFVRDDYRPARTCSRSRRRVRLDLSHPCRRRLNAERRSDDVTDAGSTHQHKAMRVTKVVSGVRVGVSLVRDGISEKKGRTRESRGIFSGRWLVLCVRSREELS